MPWFFWVLAALALAVLGCIWWSCQPYTCKKCGKKFELDPWTYLTKENVEKAEIPDCSLCYECKDAALN